MILEDKQVRPGDGKTAPHMKSDHTTLKATHGCQIACICFGIPFILVEAGMNLSKCQLDLAFLATWILLFNAVATAVFTFPSKLMT